MTKLNEEISFLKAAMSQVKVDPMSLATAETALRNSLITLETKFREVKDKYSAKSKAFDELEFESQQLKTTIDGLKQEIQAANESCIGDRKERHKLEMNLIETKNRLSESIVAQRQMEDRLKVVLAEDDYLKQENAKLEESWKNEKRKGVTIERENEQIKYSTQTREKEVSENMVGQAKQIVALKAENESLMHRLEAFALDAQSRSTKDQKDILQLQQRLKATECRESDMLLGLEDLQKKIQFYKDKLQSKENDNHLRGIIKDKLIGLLRFVRQIKETVSTEVFSIRQDIHLMGTSMLRFIDEYFQGVKPRTQLRCQASALTMASVGTFGAHTAQKFDTKRSDVESLGRTMRPSGKENVDSNYSFAEKSRQLFNKYMEEGKYQKQVFQEYTPQTVKRKEEDKTTVYPLQQVDYNQQFMPPKPATNYQNLQSMIPNHYPAMPSPYYGNPHQNNMGSYESPNLPIFSAQMTPQQSATPTPKATSAQFSPHPQALGFVPANLRPLGSQSHLVSQVSLEPVPLHNERYDMSGLHRQDLPSNLKLTPNISEEQKTLTKSRSVMNHTYGYHPGSDPTPVLLTPTKVSKFNVAEENQLQNLIAQRQSGTFGAGMPIHMQYQAGGNQSSFSSHPPGLLLPPLNYPSSNHDSSTNVSGLNSLDPGMSAARGTPAPRNKPSGDRIDIQRIEKESEEISKRIQALKTRDAPPGSKIKPIDFDY